MDERIDRRRYPYLFGGEREAMWGSTPLRYAFELEPVDPELVANARAAAFVAGRVAVIDKGEFGVSAFPGGTLEPGESWMQALERELREEIGGRLIDFTLVGRLHFWSGAERAFRPHLPHPEFHQAVGHGEVKLVSQPLDPPDAEHVLSVRLLPPDEAIALIASMDPFEAELLRLMIDLRGR